jgi:prepilin-type N-terminal cleavage/methylation domain-containing protein
MSSERGYSLAELLSAIAVLTVLLAGLLATFQEGLNVYSFGAGRSEIQQNARVALDRMLRELRTAAQITTASADDVKFTFVDDSGTSVTVEYSLGGTNIQRNQTVPAIGGQPATLTGGVAGLTITYYDVSNNTTTTPGNVYSVDIQLTTQPEDTSLPNSPQVVVQGRVRLRNQ